MCARTHTTVRRDIYVYTHSCAYHICFYVHACGLKWCGNQIHLEVSFSHIFAFVSTLNALQHSVQRETPACVRALVCVCWEWQQGSRWDEGEREKGPLLHSPNRPRSFPIKEQPGLEEHLSFSTPLPPPPQLKTAWHRVEGAGREREGGLIQGRLRGGRGDRRRRDGGGCMTEELSWPFTFFFLFGTEVLGGRR